MARFYFHLKDGEELLTDDDGVDLPDVSHAKHEAIQSARELLAEAIKTGRPEVPEAFVISDEAGRTLFELPMVEVLPGPLKK